MVHTRANSSHWKLRWLLLLGVLCAAETCRGQDAGPRKAEMAGYLLVPHARVDRKFDAGFSMYVAAWPLLEHYPGQAFQSGLFGTWMFARVDPPKPEKIYSDIEGGLGWWRDTRFATETPKFIMGGVALNFVEWANGPGAGKGRDWQKPAGHYAIAQLSPWVLWPPDGLNLAQGTCGELFGYGYLPLPLATAKQTTAGKNVPTGDQCWTLFVNTGNFKGPVTFFLPYFWSRPTLDRPEVAGMFLDSRPSDPNKAVQMETQHIPAAIAADAAGTTFARVAPTRFPARGDGDAPLIHRITAYGRGALWDGVQAWFSGGEPSSGRIDPAAATVHSFESKGGATWQIYAPGTPREQKVPLAWDSFATPVALDETTYGYRWKDGTVTRRDGTVALPEYYRLGKDARGKDRWEVVAAGEVPAETKLATVEFPRGTRTGREPYVTPDEPEGSWRKPGPVAGPFEATLGDGSIVTYHWYRFADQPALMNADLTAAEREAMQQRVELLHRHWTMEREYLPPPTVGRLADLDPAVLVTPPVGLEIGHVPIVTRQAPGPDRSARQPAAAKTATFSIVAADPEAGVVGAAVASKYPAVAKVVPFVKAGVGAFCTQHHHRPPLGPKALEMLAGGMPPAAVLESLLAGDPQRDQRQLAIIDAAGRAANQNPVAAPADSRWWGGMTGRHYACQGNTLAGRDVVVAMARAYEETPGTLADRLVAALAAGDRAGGDHRGRLAAGVRVAKRGVEGHWLELDVDESDDAVEELVTRYGELRHEAKGRATVPGPR